MADKLKIVRGTTPEIVLKLPAENICGDEKDGYTK